MAYLIIFAACYVGALLILLVINKAKNDRAAALLGAAGAEPFRQQMNVPRVLLLHAWAALFFGGAAGAVACGLYWLFVK